MRESIAHEVGVEPSSEDSEHYWMELDHSADLRADDRSVSRFLQEHDDLTCIAR
jgi:hypothetical protein